MRTISTFLLSSLLLVSAAFADEQEEKTQDIMVQIQINCPMSDEFTEFAKTIPAAGHHSESFEEWKASFVASMQRLIALVESEKVNNCGWGVNTEEHVPAPVTQE